LSQALAPNPTPTQFPSPAMTNRFYFRIPEANIYECICAVSFTEAKAQAFKDWAPFWNKIEWLTPTTHAEVKLP
jgi:hypothetical protein